MLSIPHFFIERPRIVAWAIIILFLDALWPFLHDIVHGVFNPIGWLFTLVIPVVMIHNIAEAKIGSRVVYIVYCAIPVLFGMLFVGSIMPQLNAIWHQTHQGDGDLTFFRLITRMVLTVLFFSPKTIGFLMLYTKTANKWFDDGGGIPGASPQEVKSLMDIDKP